MLRNKGIILLVGLLLVSIVFSVIKIKFFDKDSFKVNVESKALEIELSKKSDVMESLSISPILNDVMNLRKGEVFTKDLDVFYGGEKDSTKVKVEIKDFDIDRNNCANFFPNLDKKTDNSAMDFSGIELVNSENGDKKIRLNAQVPKKSSNMTYWIAVVVTDLEKLESQSMSLFFLTVGDKKSEKCLEER